MGEGGKGVLVGLIAKIRNGHMLRFRMSLGLSQAKAAKMADVPMAAWLAMEGMRFERVQWEHIKRVAGLLEVGTDEICPEELRKTNLHLDRVAFHEARVDRMIAASASINESPMLEAEVDVSALRERLEEVFTSLTYRERELLKLRYGMNDGHKYTLEEVAKIFNVTRERVRHVEAQAIRKLQHPARASRLLEFVA